VNGGPIEHFSLHQPHLSQRRRRQRIDLGRAQLRQQGVHRHSSRVHDPVRPIRVVVDVNIDTHIDRIDAPHAASSRDLVVSFATVGAC